MFNNFYITNHVSVLQYCSINTFDHLRKIHWFQSELLLMLFHAWLDSMFSFEENRGKEGIKMMDRNEEWVLEEKRQKKIMTMILGFNPKNLRVKWYFVVQILDLHTGKNRSTFSFPLLILWQDGTTRSEWRDVCVETSMSGFCIQLDLKKSTIEILQDLLLDQTRGCREDREKVMFLKKSWVFQEFVEPETSENYRKNTFGNDFYFSCFLAP